MVHEFFGIHSPRFFGSQCPTIFCDFGLFNSLAQAGGGGPYYMIFHYQKHTVLNYYLLNRKPLGNISLMTMIQEGSESSRSRLT
jgi:hypothetical protein